MLMPWHVIVYHKKQRPEDPWLLADRTIRDEDYPDRDSLLQAVSQTERDLRADYPPPDYTVVSGIGPESGSPEFASFVIWLLRED